MWKISATAWDALELYEDCKAAGYARITAVNSRTEEITAPALYNLTGLQKDANRYHNLTAIRVQEITQSLYEKKLISCPRTSSRLLPETCMTCCLRLWKSCCPARNSVNMPV